MNKPLIRRLLKTGDLCNQPRAMITVAVDKFDVGKRFLKLFIVSFRPAAIFNGFRSGKNGIEVLPV